MAEEGKSFRKKWSKEEVLGLLRCYSAWKDEFSHPRKQKRAYENVLEDMIYQGITNSSTTALSLKCKMKNLLNAYKDAKDDKKQTGAAPIIVPYLNELEEIFGDKPIMSNKHTIHLGGKKATKSTEEHPSTSAFALKTISPTITQEIETCEEYIDYEILDEEEFQMSGSTSMTAMSPEIDTPSRPLSSTATSTSYI